MKLVPTKMPVTHHCNRQVCGCESHSTIEVDEKGLGIGGTQRQWQVACQAHGGWLPSTLPSPPQSEYHQQLHVLREREQSLIDQLEVLQEEIARLETRAVGETSRKRGRLEP